MKLYNLDGIFLLDKPLAMSSNHALQRVKRLFGAKKAGHTGSLDPLATGMLPICFGEATKFSQYLLESDKYYRVTAVLGVRTATGDAEGDVIATRSPDAVTLSLLENSLQQFTGVISQIPPMFSAIKFQGQPLYKLARRGIEIERQPRTVTIHRLALRSFSQNKFEIDIHCTKGTYVRTLVDDLGEVLGCGAHVSELRRTAVAPYQDVSMYTLQELESECNELGPQSLHKYVLPLQSSVQGLPAVYLTASAVFYLRTGQPVMAAKERSQGLVRLFTDSGEFIGIGEMLDDGRVAPRRLIGFQKNIAKAV